MTSHVLRAPKTITVGVHQLVYIAIALAAAALVAAALASSSGNATVSGSAVSSGRAVAVTQPDDGIPPGSGVTFGLHPK
jgi:hypothetical protein